MARIEPIQRLQIYKPIECNRNVDALSWCSINAQLGYGLCDVLLHIETDANARYQTFGLMTTWNLSRTAFYIC
jgi:hypothetical protein